MNGKYIDRRELAEFAAALLTRIRKDDSVDLEGYRNAQAFFIEYIKDTESLNAFIEKRGYVVIEGEPH